MFGLPALFSLMAIGDLIWLPCGIGGAVAAIDAEFNGFRLARRWLRRPSDERTYRGVRISEWKWEEFRLSELRATKWGRFRWWRDVRSERLAIRIVNPDGPELVSKWLQYLLSAYIAAQVELTNHGGIDLRGVGIIGFEGVVADMSFAIRLEVARSTRAEAAAHFVDHVGGDRQD